MTGSEAITGEWLETLGFERRQTPVLGRHYWQKGLMTFSSYTDVEFCNCHLTHIQTRQQMLDACRVLGVIDQ